MTPLEIRLASYAAILVVVAGLLSYERLHGEAIIKTIDHTAEVQQAQKDRDNANAAVNDLQARLDAIAANPPAAAPIRVCNKTDSVSSRPAPRQTKPVAPADSGSSGGVQAGTESSVDIGTAVQDITLSSMLCSADVKQLWQLAVKESTN